MKKYKLIYNPMAGNKRRFGGLRKGKSLEDIECLLKKYEMSVDFAPTSGPGDAQKLACAAVSEGYDMVIAAGGDGTVSEVANGLVGSDVELGILPMGSFMNIAQMLSIPRDLEDAVKILKIGRSRKIDVGCITRVSGKKLNEKFYFLETAGVGLDAPLQKQFLQMEKGHPTKMWDIIKTLYYFYSTPVEIELDDRKIITKATLVSISNGPFTGANIKIAPDSKLNDHKLTVNLHRMTNIEIALFLGNLEELIRNYQSKIETYQSTVVKVNSVEKEKPIHADARFFGTTPVEICVVPDALSVIAGFSDPGKESALVPRTYLSP